MIKINIPSILTDSLALCLLNEVLPREAKLEDITNFDFEGKSAITERENHKEGFVYKAAAALGYVESKDDRNAAYCYSRAATSALRCDLPLAAIVCAGRSLAIYPYLLAESQETGIEREMIQFIPNKIEACLAAYQNIYEEVKPKRLNEYEHNWFTIKKSLYVSAD